MSEHTRETMPPVPPGMVRLANYGTITPGLYADITPLEQGTGDLHGCPIVRLQHITRGYVVAGSCCRWDEACWSVQWDDNSNNTTHGKRFKIEHEAEARAYYAKLTDPQAVSARRQHDAMMEDTVYAPARAERAARLAAHAEEERARKDARRRARRIAA